MNQEPETYQRTTGQYETGTGEMIAYERFETVIPIAGLVCEERVREACRSCPRHGRNLACPPRSPGLRVFAAGRAFARIICIRISLDQDISTSRVEASYECFDHARDILVAALLECRGQGFAIAGSGSCQVCEICAGEAGLDACPTPEKMIYSLESLGVNVVALAKTCFGIDLDWSADERAAIHICAIGAVFL